MDTKLLNEILDGLDHPVYVYWDELDHLFDILKSDKWLPTKLTFPCFFCAELSTYRNKNQLIFICDHCFGQLENQEIDLMDPENQPVSVKLRSLVCDWIDLNYYSVISANDLFNDCKFTWNICTICQKEINQEDDVAIPTDNAIAHYICASTKGFRNFYSKYDYNQIMNGHIDNLISEL